MKSQQEKRAEAEKEEKEKGRTKGQVEVPRLPRCRKGGIGKQTPAPPKTPEPVVPIRSKLPKKNKSVTRPTRIPKDNEVATDEMSAAPSVAASEAPAAPTCKRSGVYLFHSYLLHALLPRWGKLTDTRYCAEMASEGRSCRWHVFRCLRLPSQHLIHGACRRRATTGSATKASA